ncbi:cyclin-T1-4-like isoform X2 [Tripterygium wilfordii]|uniref:cyclin-T1-4-like isoform X2 n=1 Tax=Tripterygium wilfordii TaxID=458696 RepID=UPI0018F7F60C|nr:cyclin-T1-4-like isoform X2 [Tripterygium wilfordii]
MAAMLPGESSHQVQGGSEGSGYSRNSLDRQPDEVGRWYFSRKEIEESSPSRRDVIDLKKETYFRKSYCTFLQDLGMRLKVPQTIATVCMFLAGKVEETPRPLKDVIVVSYEIINKKDPAAAQRIKQKEVYEQQKELVLLGERVVLATLGFDLNLHHPYKPLVEAIKKFKVAQNALAQVAWNFVNDGLRTSLCLQFKPHHIAAGAIFLAAKFLKVKLPSDGEKVWWQEFDVTPHQLEEVSNQMLELYEQNRVLPSQGSEAEGSAGGEQGHRDTTKAPVGNEEHASKQLSSRPETSDNHGVAPRTSQNLSNDNGNTEMGSVITDHKLDSETKDDQHPEHLNHKENMREYPNGSKPGAEQMRGEDQERTGGRNDVLEAGDWRNDGTSRKSNNVVGRNLDLRESPLGHFPKDAIKMFDKDKVKAALEKRKKYRGETTRKKDVMDEDDLIERELEDGVELAAEVKRDGRQSWNKTGNSDGTKDRRLDRGEIGDGNHVGRKGQSSRGLETENAEEGEMIDDASPMPNSRKRKVGSPADRQLEGKKRHDYLSNNHDTIEDGHRMARGGHVDREHRKHSHDNHF